jgi:hypothetical protein
VPVPPELHSGGFNDQRAPLFGPLYGSGQVLF